MQKLLNNLYVIVSRDISTDSNDKTNTIVKIVDRFTVEIPKEHRKRILDEQKPALIETSYAISTAWEVTQKLKKETQVDFAVTVIDPDGKRFEGPRQQHAFPPGSERLNVNFIMGALPVFNPGKYYLEVEVFSADKKKIGGGSYPFNVEIITKGNK